MIRYFFIILLITSCATSPTGRKQLLLYSSDTVNALGDKSFEEMKKKVPIEKSKRINRFVKCVTDPIISTQGGNWEIVVFKDKSANAFALPGRKIGVHTGLLKVAQSDGQLAAVIGHEVGHVIANHGNERISQNVIAQIGMTGVNAYLVGSSKNKNSQRLIMAALGMGAQVAVLLPYSRAHESEADIIGLDLMAQAGFDPRESVKLWENMERASGGGRPPEFLSTHPAEGTRINNLNARMDSAMRTYRDANKAGKKPNCKRPKNI